MESPAEITIICTKTTPRLQYVANFLSSTTQVNIIVDAKLASADEFRDRYLNSGHCTIYYGDTPIDGVFNIFSAGLLYEYGISEQEPIVIKQPEQFLLYPAPQGFDMPFDLFSAVFFLLSRYEEYLPFKPDMYGRFEADQSLAFRYGFLEEPVVDQWIDMLKSALRLKYPMLVFPDREFRFMSTFDVDSPWAFLHKRIIRTAGGLFKNVVKLNMREFQLRLDVLRGKSLDPFDTYDYIRKTEQLYNFRSLFFFLSGDYGQHDVNYALETVPFKNLLALLKSERTIGIHPSVKATRNAALLKSEFDRFSQILGNKPEISRQHFLILGFPETYRQLIANGIKEDFSMGYASCPGFRAGISTSFRFYDLVSEYETSLVIHPFLVMDVTLIQYLGLDTIEAMNRINHLVKKVKAVNGTFTSLWHNESLSEHNNRKGWRDVFEGMVRQMKK